jgi:hypothetical protein
MRKMLLLAGLVTAMLLVLLVLSTTEERGVQNLGIGSG